MNRADILRMAQEADVSVAGQEPYQTQLVRFAELVAKAERECERLQGFQDGHTDVPYRGKPAAGGPRYKAIGNSWAVPVVAWIGRRIDAVEAIRQTNSATQAVAETETA